MKMISTKNTKNHEGKELILGDECFAIVGAAMEVHSCYGQIVVELKAMDRGAGKEESQILNYLKATGMKAGLLINFGSHGKLEWRKFVN